MPAHAHLAGNCAVQSRICQYSIARPSRRALTLHAGRAGIPDQDSLPPVTLFSDLAYAECHRRANRMRRCTCPNQLSRASPTAQTRRRLGGRQPLWGIGVTSRIDETLSPAACSARTADSRPPPGPFTKTITVRIPKSATLRAAASAAIWAANGVPLREPLKPTEPALDHATTAPCGSVIATMVLLKV